MRVARAAVTVVLAAASILASGAGAQEPGHSARPVFMGAPLARVAAGEVVSVTVEAVTPRGPAPVMTVWGLPAGAIHEPALGRVSWVPRADQVGDHHFVATASAGAAMTRRSYTVQVREPPHPEVVLAMGDSIASGHGLSRRDYLGGDRCWRAEGKAWPERTVRQLNAARPHDSRLVLHYVACSGAAAGDLDSWKVGGPGRLVGGGRRTQLQWAADVNPGLILLSVGANDLRFDQPKHFFSNGGLDRSVLDLRTAAMGAGVDEVLDRLVTTTDATIVLTSVHNPVAADPHGVPECRRECFAGAVTEAVAVVNARLAAAAARHPVRVLFVDVGSAFEGHGAPNGRGPDAWRAGRTTIARYLPLPTEGVHPYCQKGHERVDTFINSTDCVHPNGKGAQAYADKVVEAMIAANRVPTW